ncbi:MAG: RIP metalloprotease RseP [Proteobacteria bacterium]|nr:RIP metalloprotease RseP [Pseudomonadota bacterium]
MEVLLYPIAFLVMLGVLVTVHEFGHYLVARRSGVRILRFSVGFGSPLWSRVDRRGTEFAIAGIPLGGYLRMLDERDPDFSTASRPGDVAFMTLSPWWRIAISLGGPAANFVLAFVVYWGLALAGTTSVVPMVAEVDPQSMVGRAGLVAGREIVAVDGVRTYGWQQINLKLADRLGETGQILLDVRVPGDVDGETLRVDIDGWMRGAEEPDLLGSLGLVPALLPTLGQVLEDSAAQRGGLTQWDRILKVDGQALESWSDWVATIQVSAGQTLDLEVARGRTVIGIQVTPDERAATDGSTVGYLGVGPMLHDVSFGPIDAIPEALSETADKTMLTLNLLRKMVQGDVSVKNLSGPISIAKVSGDSARAGWKYFLGIMGLLSISLGVMNLLPIPILDGGHIIFCLVELVKGRPVSEKTMALGTQLGLMLVGALIVFTIYNDITRLF